MTCGGGNDWLGDRCNRCKLLQMGWAWPLQTYRAALSLLFRHNIFIPAE